jgi:hypothetical protein
VQKLEKKQEILFRKNGRLKMDSRMSKRSHALQLATSYQLNVSRRLAGASNNGGSGLLGSNGSSTPPRQCTR